MIGSLPPGLPLLLGPLLIPLLRGRLRQLWILMVPVLSAIHLLLLPAGHSVSLEQLGYELMPVRLDQLSLVFGYVFHLAAFLGSIYALHVKDDVQHIAGQMYAGSAISAVFAGDLITLFVFWELTAVTSVFLIWASRTPNARSAGMRYLLIQVGSGVLLLAGIALHYSESGSLAFDLIGLDSPGGALILLAFGIKCAFPFLHNWLQDSYPEGTVAGTVFLSAFTTKLAVYALARGFAGTSVLIPIGAVMTLFPVFFAVIENDLRRVLAYSLNNQLGFMVVGIGIGTELSLNGTASHAFAHIVYKALLFMSMGAVLHRAGTIKGSELGGLYKSMPLTTVFCIVGALSISGFPFFSGFVSKSMILSAGAHGQMVLLSIVLLIASAGVVHHSSIKIPFFAFFARDSGIRVKEAPWNMLVAMGIAAAVCIAIGLYPAPLYALLPYPVDYEPYTATHLVSTAQLLVFAVLAFCVLMRSGVYPPELRAINLDTDWVYRRALPVLWSSASGAGERVGRALTAVAIRARSRLMQGLARHHRPPGLLGEPWPTGATVMWAAALLAVYLLAYYLV